IKGEWKSDDKLFLNLEKYAQAEVETAPAYQPPPPVSFDLGDSLGVTIPFDEIYVNRMFHGPAYQGIKAIYYVGKNGMTGLIEGSTGKGSLLDNAGQLYGLWLQFRLEKDRIAFPVRVQEIEYFGDPMDQSGTFECSCELTELNEQFATANIVLKKNDRVWALITGWQNRRLELDQKLWNVSVAPAQHLLSEELAPDVFMFYNAYQKVSSWDFIIRRYFNKNERDHLNTLLPNKRREWIISRVAAKDAIRKRLEETVGEVLYPLEYEIQKDENGKPFASGEVIEDLNISIAHKKDIAVSMARQSKPVGIDIEVIEERRKDFESLFLNQEEVDLLPEAAGERPEWITRFWVAKEAYGKSLGKGLEGKPKQYKIQQVSEDELLIAECWIKTIKHENYIIGWTK
ncbi:MAG: 4'-phosphopantetheinyl transferase superfamily protein, partial [Bacteroidota bacterium]